MLFVKNYERLSCPTAHNDRIQPTAEPRRGRRRHEKQFHVVTMTRQRRPSVRLVGWYSQSPATIHEKQTERFIHFAVFLRISLVRSFFPTDRYEARLSPTISRLVLGGIFRHLVSSALINIICFPDRQADGWIVAAQMANLGRRTRGRMADQPGVSLGPFQGAASRQCVSPPTQWGLN